VKDVIDLKQRFSREVQVHGSCGLAQTLIEKDLIDEYRLLTFPVVLGTGKRLFDAGAMPATLALVRSNTTSKGCCQRLPSRRESQNRIVRTRLKCGVEFRNERISRGLLRGASMPPDSSL
jgi:dihydrofolate reductase